MAIYLIGIKHFPPLKNYRCKQLFIVFTGEYGFDTYQCTMYNMLACQLLPTAESFEFINHSCYVFLITAFLNGKI